MLKYHVVLVCKYRRPLLDGEILRVAMLGLERARQMSAFEVEVAEADRDHVHLLVSAPPALSPLSIVRRLKQVSTCFLWLHCGHLLKRAFWKERTFWTDGYFVCSVGNVSQAVVRKYIESQG